MKNVSILKLAGSILCLAGVAYGQIGGAIPGGGVATWSVQTNTSTWNRTLGVSYTRQGCSDTPANCVSFVRGVAQLDNVKVTLAIPLNATTTVADARQYSQLSLSAPFLGEVSIDDFVDQYNALARTSLANPATVVAEVIANLKSANRNLAFGATFLGSRIIAIMVAMFIMPRMTYFPSMVKRWLPP